MTDSVETIGMALHRSIIDLIETKNACEVRRLMDIVRGANQLVMENHARYCELLRGLAAMHTEKDVTITPAKRAAKRGRK